VQPSGLQERHHSRNRCYSRRPPPPWKLAPNTDERGRTRNKLSITATDMKSRHSHFSRKIGLSTSTGLRYIAEAKLVGTFLLAIVRDLRTA
jgi:hypothetical protein